MDSHLDYNKTQPKINISRQPMEGLLLKKNLPSQADFKDKKLAHQNLSKGQSFQSNNNNKESKIMVKKSAEKNSTKDPHIPQTDGWLATQINFSHQADLIGKNFAHQMSPKTPNLQANKKESAEKNSPKDLHIPKTHGKVSTQKNLPDQPDLKKKQSANKNLLKGQDSAEKNSIKEQHNPKTDGRVAARKSLPDQPDFKEKQLAHKNSSKGQNFQANNKQPGEKNLTKKPPVEEIKNQVMVPSHLVLKFTNLLMLDGKKNKALSTLSKSLSLFKKHVENLSCDAQFIELDTENKKTTLDYLYKAVYNIKPSLEVRKKKISGIMRQIPAIPFLSRQETLGIRWIIESARKKKKKL